MNPVTPPARLARPELGRDCLSRAQFRAPETGTQTGGRVPECVHAGRHIKRVESPADTEVNNSTAHPPTRRSCRPNRSRWRRCASLLPARIPPETPHSSTQRRERARPPSDATAVRLPSSGRLASETRRYSRLQFTRKRIATQRRQCEWVLQHKPADCGAALNATSLPLLAAARDRAFLWSMWARRRRGNHCPWSAHQRRAPERTRPPANRWGRESSALGLGLPMRRRWLRRQRCNSGR